MIKEYVTVRGDTFDAIAYRLWGSEHLAFRLVEANPDHADVVTFGPNVRLVVPAGVEKPQKKSVLPPWFRETK